MLLGGIVGTRTLGLVVASSCGGLGLGVDVQKNTCSRSLDGILSQPKSDVSRSVYF